MFEKLFDKYEDSLIDICKQSSIKIMLVIFTIEISLFVIASFLLNNFQYAFILGIALACRGKHGNHNEYILQCTINSFTVICMYVILCSQFESLLLAILIAISIAFFTSDLTDAFYYNANHSGKQKANEQDYIQTEELFKTGDEVLEELKTHNNDYYKQLQLYIVNEVKLCKIAERYNTYPRQILRNLNSSIQFIKSRQS